MDSQRKKSFDVQTSAFSKFVLFGLLATFMMVAPEAAYATGSPMGCVLCIVMYWTFGSIGAGLSAMAVIMIGIGASLGKVSWSLALTVGVGISVLWGAKTIVLLLSGVDVDAACALSAAVCP